MMKRFAILLLATLGAIVSQAEIRWSASGIVGRDGRPWNGEVQLYKASVGMMTQWSSFMDVSATAANGQVSATTPHGDSNYADVYIFAYVIVDGGKTFRSSKAKTSTYVDMWAKRHLELTFSDMPLMNAYGSWLMTYGEWVQNNGITGAWNEKDANGIHNVFRYAFDNSGEFSETPLIDIAFNGSKAVIKTPPVKYTAGFTYWVKASSDVAGTEMVAEYELSENGQTVISDEELSGARFYRLKASAQ